MPQLGEELKIADEQLGLLVTSYALFLALFAFISGPVSDKIGRRKILLFGTGTMAFALFMHNEVYDYYSMLAVRGLAGASGGILSGACVSYLADYFPYQRRGWANGWIATGSAAGLVLGIPFGSLMANWLGFQSPFLLFSGIMLIAFFLVLFKLPQPEVPRDLKKLTIGTTLRNYATLIKNRNTFTTSIAYGLMFLSFSVFIFYLPGFLTTLCGFTGFELSLLFLIGGIGSVVAGPWAGKLSDRVGRKNIIMLSSIGLFITMLLTSPLVNNFYKAYTMFFIFMLLTSARLGPFRALVTGVTSPEFSGKLLSLCIAMGQLGMALGGVIAGIVYSNYGFWVNTVISGVAVLLYGLLVWKFIDESEIISPVPAEATKVYEN